MKRIVKAYLVIYFLLPSAAIYFTIFTGIPIPMYIELLPLLLLAVRNPRFSKEWRPADWMFLLLSAASVVFIGRNTADASWIHNIEARAFILIALNYFIFRILIRREWSGEISDTILRILELSMYLALLEFLVINIGGIAGSLEVRYVAAYPRAERLYETILGLPKPFGLFPGTHNAGIAATISLLYLAATKKISANKAFALASALVFFICFSLSAFVVLVFVYAILTVRKRSSGAAVIAKGVYAAVAGIVIYYSLTYYNEITAFRSSGTIGSATVISFQDAEYVLSLIAGLESLRDYPLGVPLSTVDLTGNEVYVSRVVMYYGYPIVVFFLGASALLITNLKTQDKRGLFFSIGYLTLFVSSFHYPSIVSYPLTILVPLAFVFLGNDREMARSGEASPVATKTRCAA